MSSAQVLIVDDDPALLLALPEAIRLRTEGISVEKTDSALSALSLIENNDYDAIVTDIKMPGMDGLALLSRIREIRPNTPTLLITGHGEYDLAVEALRGGANDYIPKPIDREYFVISLKRAIHMRQLSRKIEEQQAALEHHASNLEQTVQERTRELQEANKAKDEFLAMLAHELRNPLAPISNAMEVLRLRRDLDPSLQRVRDIVQRQAAHMSRLVDDLLDISGITRGKVDLRREIVDLDTIVGYAVEAANPLIRSRNHALEVSRAKTPVYVDADPTRLEQVIGNLLSNAAKYTDPGGGIWLNLDSRDGNAIIEVRDTGVGISAEMLPKVFDLFTQANQSLARSRGGLGIGLTLVRHLVEMHGGSVEVSSGGKGLGSLFVVKLPLAQAKAQRLHSSLRDQRVDLPQEPRRVLIIEDNHDSRETLRQLLELWGHQVEVAEDGARGLEKLLESRPEVALVDIGIPGLDGYQVAQLVRSKLGRGNFLIALTGYGQPSDRQRALEAGFDAYLVKPVDVRKLSLLLNEISRQPAT
ncbi:MAG TPA: response regulator [Acidobacteriota bacterium]|jgi:signal transduction histidine kinase